MFILERWFFVFLCCRNSRIGCFINNCHNLDTIEIDTKEEMDDDKEYQKLVDSKPIAASLLLLVLWYGINTL